MERGSPPAAPLQPLLAAALVFLFLAQAQRAFFSSLYGIWYVSTATGAGGAGVLLILLPLIALLAPLLPLVRWVDRGAAVGLSAAGVALFRLPMLAPDLAVRTASAALVLGCAALFLTWAVGHVHGRALAAGAVLGLLIDQLVRLGGVSYDLSQRVSWLPVQLVLSLALLVLATRWRRPRTHPEKVQGGLERRAGGLRLRGALAVGALLFLDLHVLGLPPVIARWTGVSWEITAAATAVAAGAALWVVLAGRGAVRSRRVSLALVTLVMLAVGMGWMARGAGPALLMAAGHGSALVLVARALAPASGRRGGRVVSAGMLTFIVLTLLYGVALMDPPTLPVLGAAAPWTLGVALLVLAGSMLLLPQPTEVEPAFGRGAPVIAALAVPGMAFLVLYALVPDRPVPLRTDTTMDPPSDTGEFRVASYNAHRGFGADGRFDPAAIAESIREAAPRLAALQEVPVGLPTAYGVDLALWLERRTGQPVFFAATQKRLLGEAFLSSLPTRQVDASPLPGTRARLLRLHALLGGRSVVFYTVHLPAGTPDRDARLQAALERTGSTWSVVLGDFGDGAVADGLGEAGFVDALTRAGAVAASTTAARSPAGPTGSIWVRGPVVSRARVIEGHAPDHRLVVANLRVPAPR